MENCIFCKIAKGEVGSEVVFEDDEVKIFKDIHPKAPVHLLVIPKVHIDSVVSLDDTHKKILSEIVYAAKDAAQKLGLNGYKLVFNVGLEGGQVIDHLHLHLLGGWGDEENKSINV